VDGILAYAAGTTDAALWGTMALAGLRLGEALGLADETTGAAPPVASATRDGS
jgi:hypothetical protein